jgi:thioredoxin-dependent peroxiredoxin
VTRNARPRSTVRHVARAIAAIAAIAGIAAVAGFGGQVHAAALAPGDAAPPFTLLGSDGQRYTLEQYAGKQGVVLAWFPKAFTPG